MTRGDSDPAKLAAGEEQRVPAEGRVSAVAGGRGSGPVSVPAVTATTLPYAAVTTAVVLTLLVVIGAASYATAARS